MVNFGWSLPPGCGRLPGEEPDPPCAVCGLDPGLCVCPECPTCGEQGNPACYAEAGQRVQVAFEAKVKACRGMESRRVKFRNLVDNLATQVDLVREHIEGIAGGRNTPCRCLCHQHAGKRGKKS